MLDSMLDSIVVNKETGEGIKLTSTKKLYSHIGYHSMCGGSLDIRPISTSHQAINCRSCNLRIVIPMSVKTPEELKEYMSTTNKTEVYCPGW